MRRMVKMNQKLLIMIARTEMEINNCIHLTFAKSESANMINSTNAYTQ